MLDYVKFSRTAKYMFLIKTCQDHLRISSGIGYWNTGINACRYAFPHWTWTWLFGRGVGLGLEDSGLRLALGLGCCWTCYKYGFYTSIFTRKCYFPSRMDN